MSPDMAQKKYLIIVSVVAVVAIIVMAQGTMITGLSVADGEAEDYTFEEYAVEEADTDMVEASSEYVSWCDRIPAQDGFMIEDAC